MKNLLFSLLIILHLAFLFQSCQDTNTKDHYLYDHENDVQSLSPFTRSLGSDNFILEEAFPYAEKSVVPFKDDIFLERLGDYYIFQGDIVLDQEQVDNLASIYSSSRSTATTDYLKYWPNHKVYYTYGSGFSGQAYVQSAIQEWESKTGLDFVYGMGNGNYIEFLNNTSEGNYSNSLGMKGGRQIITLQTGSYTAGTVIHEIGHSVGLFHEHCRSDRDSTITVLYHNIQSGKSSQFALLNPSDCVCVGPFDFNSVMLYGSYAFSSNNLPTITKLDGSTFAAQRDSLSVYDAEGAKAIYGPPFHHLESTLISSDYQDYGGISEEWSLEKDYTVHFYEDKSYTVPTQLQYNRLLRVRHTSVRIVLGSYDYYYNDYSVVVPAGSSSYNLGVAYTNMHSEYGIPSGQDEYYELLF